MKHHMICLNHNTSFLDFSFCSSKQAGPFSLQSTTSSGLYIHTYIHTPFISLSILKRSMAFSLSFCEDLTFPLRRHGRKETKLITLFFFFFTLLCTIRMGTNERKKERSVRCAIIDILDTLGFAFGREGKGRELSLLLLLLLQTPIERASERAGVTR